MTWLWLLLVVPVAWFIQNCIHELSHLIVGWIHEGREPLGFYPYPHKHNGKWYFARCVSGPAEIGRQRPHPPRHIAPFFGGLIVAAIFSLLTVLTQNIILIPFIICGTIDALWFWRGYFWSKNPYNDGQRWRYGK